MSLAVPPVAQPRVLVTGGSGFLGKHLLDVLARRGYQNVTAPRHADYDLTRSDQVAACIRDLRPDAIVHLAAVVGGIGANRANPGSFFYDNLAMGALLMEHARRRGVEKFLAVGTVCAYPKTNLYGPGDNFDPRSSHVIPALIRKCVEAIDNGDDEIVVWGTGQPTREFLFAGDCAEGIIAALERYDSSEPVNLGSGEEIRISELAHLIAEATGFNGQIHFDPTQPDGQPRRKVDASRALEEFGWQSTTSFPDGLRATVDWYRAAREPTDAVYTPATP